MSKHGLRFTGDEVRAILAGTKTQTRRPLKPQPVQWKMTSVTGHPAGPAAWGYVTGAGRLSVADYWSVRGIQLGDSVWVRETWRYSLPDSIQYKADNASRVVVPPSPVVIPNERLNQWRPPTYMSRWAARIVLPVVAKREERLQAIAPDDCEAEGITGVTYASPVRGQPYDEYKNGDGLVYTTPREALAALWDSIYGDKPGLSWAENPWVQVTELEPYHE